MRRWLSACAVVVLAALGVVAGPAPLACACSCANGTEAEYQEWADLIFTGVTVDANQSPLSLVRSSADPVTYTFAVESVHKGVAPSRISITSAMDSAICGASFAVGYRYRVYAKAGETNLCAGNRQLAAAPDVPIDAGPDEWVSDHPVLTVGATGLSLLLIVGTAVVLRRRQKSA